MMNSSGNKSEEYPPVAKDHIKKKFDFLPWALVLPAVLYLLIINIYPLIYVFGLSFTLYPLASTAPPRFIGLTNFGSVLVNGRFWDSLKVTLWFSFFNVIVQVVLGFGVAMLLNNLRRGRQFITTLLLLPMMIAPAVVAFIWKMIYNPYWGPLNYIIFQLVGKKGPSWASDPILALPALLVADIWQWTPFTVILLLAGLQSLPRSVYEAAYIDGSSSWQVFKNITLPLMYPFVYLAFILRVIDSFKIFDFIYIITKGGPGTVTENLAWFTYETGFVGFDIGWASALSIIQLIIIIIVAQFALKALGRPKTQVDIAISKADASTPVVATPDLAQGG